MKPNLNYFFKTFLLVFTFAFISCNSDDTDEEVIDNQSEEVIDDPADEMSNDPSMTTVEVAALQLDNPSGATPVEGLITQTLSHLDALEAAHPNVDAVVTPEYNFYNTCRDCPAFGLVLNKIGDSYVVDEENSDALYISLFQQLQAKAIAMNTYIFAGTFPEKYFPDVTTYPFMPDAVTFNSMLIINRQGEIEDIDRKLPASDWIRPLPVSDFTITPDPIHGFHDPNDPYYQRAVELVNSTSYVREMKNANGDTFSYLPIICQERPDPRMLNAAAESGQASVIFYSEREGDVQYQFLTEQINGLPTTLLDRDFDRDWALLIDEHPASSFDAVIPDGYLVATDRGSGAGIIQFQQAPILDIDVTTSYTYGKINVPKSDTQ